MSEGSDICNERALSDLTAFWEHLESGYGDEIEIVNSVITEIHYLQLNKSDQDGS